MEKYNVYKVNSFDGYKGYTLIGAETVEEARKILDAYKKTFENTHNVFYGTSFWVGEEDILPNIYADKKGILFEGIQEVR